MSYEVNLTDEIAAIYTAHKAGGLGTQDDMEISFLIFGIEVTQPNLEAKLRFEYEQKLWQDLRERRDEAILDLMLDDLVLEPSEWLTGGVK